MKGQKNALSFYYFAANYPRFRSHFASLRYSGAVARLIARRHPQSHTLVWLHREEREFFITPLSLRFSGAVARFPRVAISPFPTACSACQKVF
ncbi:MAG: hypothetical protein II117_01450 [Clostridia bacterium]|nr:hypothetical protein [Clostridia bacterium]